VGGGIDGDGPSGGGLVIRCGALRAGIVGPVLHGDVAGVAMQTHQRVADGAVVEACGFPAGDLRIGDGMNGDFVAESVEKLSSVGRVSFASVFAVVAGEPAAWPDVGDGGGGDPPSGVVMFGDSVLGGLVDVHRSAEFPSRGGRGGFERVLRRNFWGRFQVNNGGQSLCCCLHWRRKSGI